MSIVDQQQAQPPVASAGAAEVSPARNDNDDGSNGEVGGDKKPFIPPPLREPELSRVRALASGTAEADANATTAADSNNTASIAVPPPAPAKEETAEEKAARLAREAQQGQERHRQEMLAQRAKDIKSLESGEFDLRDQIEDSEAADFKADIVDAELAHRSDIVRVIREEAAQIRFDAAARREAAAKLVTALNEVRSHFVPHQVCVNVTKEYANVAILCRHFDAWLTERFLGNGALNQHTHTDLVTVAELEQLHAERDGLLEELQRLADNLASLREHLVLDEGDLTQEQAEKIMMDESRMYASGMFDDAATETGTAHGGGGGNGALVAAAAAGGAAAAQQQPHYQHQPHHIDAHTITSEGTFDRTSAHSRAQEALRNEANLIAKLRALVDEKRELEQFMAHRERDCKTKVKQCELKQKAADAGMAGINKDLSRLEAAVDAHWRVLRTTYNSFRADFPDLVEFDAFMNPNGHVSAARSVSRGLIADESPSTSMTLHGSADLAVTSGATAAAASGDVARSRTGSVSLPTFLVLGSDPKHDNKPSVGTHRATGSIARDAARLTSNVVLDRQARVAAIQHQEKAAKSKTTLDSVKDMKEEFSARREQAKKSAAEYNPKEETRRKLDEERKKMVSPMEFKRL